MPAIVMASKGISCCVADIKYHSKDNLQNGDFIWCYRSRRVRIHDVRETQQQVVGMETEAGS